MQHPHQEVRVAVVSLRRWLADYLTAVCERAELSALTRKISPTIRKKGALRSDFIDGLSTELKWHVSKIYSFRQTSHINLQELRALAIETRDWTRPSCVCGHNIIQLGLCDSAIVIGALGKGRSSSCKLNGVLRGMLGPMLVTGNSWALNFIGTHANPADYSSRRKGLPDSHRTRLGANRPCQQISTLDTA